MPTTPNTASAITADAPVALAPRPLRERCLAAASGATVIAMLLIWIVFGTLAAG